MLTCKQVDEVCNDDTPSSPEQMRNELDELRELRREILDTSQLHVNTGNSQDNLSTPEGTAKPGPSSTSPEEVPLFNEGDKPIVTYARTGRKRKPAAVLRSPFLPNDVSGTDFQRYMKKNQEL